MVARTGKPWAVVITAIVCACVAAGALATAATMRDQGRSTTQESKTPETGTSGVGIDGCLVDPCEVLSTVPVGDITVELVADYGQVSGRLRIGGAGVSKVIEATITSMGATLTKDSLQCVASTLSACLLRGQIGDGTVGQVAVGRSGKWSELAQLFESEAGYLALADITEADPGAEVLVAQHDCDQTVADCTTTPVYVEVYNLRGQQLGCTRDYAALDSLPGWPTVKLTSTALKPCA